MARLFAHLRSAALAVSTVLVVGGLSAGQGTVQAQKFETTAPNALLMDSATGAVLFEKNADELTAPASLAKLMTAAVLFEEMRKGRISADTEFVVSENAWRKGGAPSRGSSMFLALNSKVKVADLIPGLVVLSGNDAAIVIAEGIAGSEDNFARMMTARARELGLPKSTFKNASGMGDAEQKSTARELAFLADHIIKTFPDKYPVFALREFTWGKIKQQNRNPLLGLDIGADGLKTGNIGESGFGLVGSAVRDGQRLIVVVIGSKTAGERSQEARKLLDWGFRAFDSKVMFKEGAVIGTARVYGGDSASVTLVAQGVVRLLVPRGATEKLTAKIIYQGPLIPPVEKGAKVARLVVTRGTVQALDLPLYTAESVGVGTLSRRAVDAALEYGRDLVRRAVGNRILMVMEGPARFVTFEGGEGAGKSTQVRRLVAALEQHGILALATREPGGSPRAELIREAILSGEAKKFGPFAEALLFAAARQDHLVRTIRPALARGRWVLCDRFADSTRVYQGVAGAVPERLLLDLERLIVADTRPDLTIILDLPARTGLARAAARGGGTPDRFESESIETHERIRAGFLAIAAAEPERCVVIEADREVDAVAADVWRAVASRLLDATPGRVTHTAGAR